MATSIREPIRNIAGISALPRGMYFVVAAQSLLAAMGLSTQISSIATFLTQLLANLVALALCWIWYELFERLTRKARSIQPIAMAWLLLFGLVLGAIKGGATGATLFVLGAESNLLDSIASRTFQTSILGSFTAITIAYLALAQKRLQDERDILVTALVKRDLSENSSSDAGNIWLDGVAKDSAVLGFRELLQQIKVKILVGRDSLLAQTQSQMNTDEDLPPNQAPEISRQYAKFLNEIVDLDLRPLSHQLWEKQNSKYPNYSIADLAKQALTREREPVFVFCLLFFIVIGLSLEFGLKAQDGWLRAALESIILLICMHLFQLIRPKNTVGAAVVFVLVNALSGAAIIFVTDYFLGVLPQSNSFSVYLVTIFWVMELNLIARLFAAAVHTRDSILHDSSELMRLAENDSRLLSVRNLLVRRELANYLHGKVQNQFLAAVLRLKDDSEQTELVDEVIAELLVVLDDASFEFQSRESLADELFNIQERWLGFVQLEIMAPNDLDAISESTKERVLQVINEGITNAVRHGLAKHIRIELALESHAMTLVLIDDGLGPRKSAAGLGSRLFDSISGNNWQLVPHLTGGSILRIVIPL